MLLIFLLDKIYYVRDDILSYIYEFVSELSDQVGDIEKSKKKK